MKNESNSSKVLANIDNNKVLTYTIRSIVEANICRGIIITCRNTEKKQIEEILKVEAKGLDNAVILGGETRQESVYLGLTVLEHRADYVLIHDAARPLCSVEKIKEVANAAEKYKAATLGLPLKFSIKKITAENFVEQSLARENIWEVQTPQVFSYDLIISAHKNAMENNIQVTDDCELVENMGFKVAMISGNEENIKITTPYDLELVKFLFQTKYHF